MTLALWTPTPPERHLEDCTDDERRIDGKCWDLAGVQAAIDAQTLRIVLAPSSQVQMYEELRWCSDDLKGFIRCLHAARYVGSEWCLPSRPNNKIPPMPADAYCMGYNRFKVEENQSTLPWIYVKFTIKMASSAILVFSAHPQRLKGSRK